MAHILNADDNARVILQVFHKLNARADVTVVPDYVLVQGAMKLGLTQHDYRRGLEHAKVERWIQDTNTGGYKVTALGYAQVSLKV